MPGPGSTTRECDEKTERLSRLLAARGLDGVLLAAEANVAWLTGGGRSIIDTSQERGACALLVTRTGARVVLANGIEMPRLLAEELAGLGFEPAGLRWIDEQESVDRLVGEAKRIAGAGARLGADLPLGDLPNLAHDLMRCRAPLTVEEIARLRALGRDSSAAVEAVCRSAAMGAPERAVAAQLECALAQHGIRSVVTLVAADERLAAYRHPVPTDRAWHERLMIVTCARRHGLTVALTRIVGTQRDAELARRTRAAAEVFGALWANTRPGERGASLYEVARDAYAAAGFPGEELRHHQGGACGYLSRDWIAHPASDERVQDRQAFAWNPSIAGTKVEDTCIRIGERIEPLTRNPGWPSVEVSAGTQTMAVCDVLVR